MSDHLQITPDYHLKNRTEKKKKLSSNQFPQKKIKRSLYFEQQKIHNIFITISIIRMS